MTVTGIGPANGQFGRKVSLIVSAGTNGLDLSQLRFRFEVHAADTETPNTATIRVYNVSDNSANSIIKEFTSVTLQAGYQNGNLGIIFQGDIKQFRRGRERNVDSYLDILAADGDEAYNFGVVSKSFAAGSSPDDQLSALSTAMGTQLDPNAASYASTGGILPRGQVMFGMARLYMRSIAKNNNARWSIQNGKVTLVPITGYLPGDVIVLNSATGMLGTPEQTDNGIKIRCYLNPLIKIGQRVQINNSDINQTTIKSQFFPSYTSQYYPASISSDGIYRVLVVECAGDTRANDFYSELTCLSIDPSSSPATSVLSHG